jgi:hypothetical protein
MLLEVDMHPFFVIFVCVCKTHASFFFCHHSCDVCVFWTCDCTQFLFCFMSQLFQQMHGLLVGVMGGEGRRISRTGKSTGASACRCALQHAIYSWQSWSAGELTSPQNSAPTREAGMCLGTLRALDFLRHLKGFRILQPEGFLEILEAGWQHTGIDTWSFS